MKHKTRTHELVAYLDGELSEREHTRITSALRASPALQQEAAHLKQVGSLVANLNRVTPAADFAETFWQRLEQDSQQAGYIEEETLLTRWQREWHEWREWFIDGHGWQEWLPGGQWAPVMVPVASLLIILGSLFSGSLMLPGPSLPGASQVANRRIPAQVLEDPAFFRDYWLTVRLERWKHFNEIAKTQLPSVKQKLSREEVPPVVAEDPNFFVNYPIIRRMEEFQYFESVLNTPVGHRS